MTFPAGIDPSPYDPPPPPPQRGEAAVRWAIIGLLMVLVVGLSFGLGFGTRLLLEHQESGGDASAVSVLREDGSPDFRVLDDIYSAIKNNFVDGESLEAEVLRTGAINGLINAVGDPHQVYMTKTQAELDDTDLRGQFEGIGATVDQKGGEIIIVRPFKGSPAEASGVKAGDVILAINGESTKGMTDKDAVRKIRGKKGTEVKIRVRHSDGKEQDLAIVRDEIKLPSVQADRAQDAAGNPVDDLAYVRIEQFTARTPDELKTFLQSIEGKGYKGLILDLRNNPGGLLSSVQMVGSQFMRDQPLLIEQYRDGKEEVLRTRGTGLAADPTFKIVVLVNHNSASASEILAGAFKDNKRGLVIGETTLGKGTVNRFFDLSDGGKVYVTVGRWLTPKRDQIEGKGIKPDVEVRVGDNENPLDYFNSVMFRAVELLRSGS